MYKKLICLISFMFVLTSVAEADLVGLWRFDETSGTTAHDGSGNGRDGTLIGNPKWTAGRIGGALDFDGRPRWHGWCTTPGGNNGRCVHA